MASDFSFESTRPYIYVSESCIIIGIILLLVNDDCGADTSIRSRWTSTITCSI